jgi:hypothetical protein
VLAALVLAQLTVTEPEITPAPAWLVTQLLPSPELAIAEDGGAHFGLRWQLTPVLFSYGVHRRLSPWRFFVVEPVVRHSGSTELYVTPEYLAVHSAFRERWYARVGLRSYFPVLHRGEYLSLSLGSSYLQGRDADSASYEGGVHFLFGVLGVLTTFTPGFDPARYTVTLNVRVF